MKVSCLLVFTPTKPGETTAEAKRLALENFVPEAGCDLEVGSDYVLFEIEEDLQE